MNFVYGDSKRIFVNTEIGCDCSCSYCYIDRNDVNYSKRRSAIQIIDYVLELRRFKPGCEGTIISIGCYSECWNEKNKKDTLKLIEYFAAKGNYIQLATKKEITREEILKINSLAVREKQIGIHISLPTLSLSEKLEKGTDRIENRIKPLIDSYNKKFEGIYFAIYIKPVIKNVTILDLDRYRKLQQESGAYLIVGPMLSAESCNWNMPVQVGEGMLGEVNSFEENMIIDSLNIKCKVYRHSVEIIEDLRLNG